MPRPITEFEARVYAALEKIPAGKVISYRRLAETLGIRSAQAVGQALKRNPNAPEVPCHRVVRSDGSIGGYQGASAISDPSLQRKLQLLRQEGVEFDGNGVLLEPGRLIKSI